MPGGFSNKPKILRGAFVEFGLTIPPLFVVFQFNPVQLSRSRSLSFSGENTNVWDGETLREFHQKSEFINPLEVQKRQVVTVSEENINFEIRLDATDKLNEGDTITEQFGVSPQLSTLELMVYPKAESLLGTAVDLLLGLKKGFSFTKSDNPPLILFIFGRKRIIPVNINSIDITETEFSTDLNPIRANVNVSLTVIEGTNIPYMYTKAMKEVMSVLNLANIADIKDIVLPG